MESENEPPLTNGHGDPKYIVSTEGIEAILAEPPRPLTGDITFEEVPTGFEIWYSERIERDNPDLVDQSADFLEEELGVLNLGQVDHKILMADGSLTDEVKDGLITWWRGRVDHLDLG
jgi:hypothetical protein